MKCILNIGMHRSLEGAIAPGGEVNRMHVQTALLAAGMKLLSIEAVYPSNGEPAWVCVVDDVALADLYKVSAALDQDCIAVGYYDSPFFKGALVGPRAKEWGEFNPALFEMPTAGV